jgi:rubrerythrin
MGSVSSGRALSAVALCVALVAGMATGTLVAGAGPKSAKPAAPPDAKTPIEPTVRDTPENLQAAFTNEMNAKEWYMSASRAADREGFAAVARLFRACARSEQVQADRHVQAIAWRGGEAKAFLDRITIGTTEENLRGAVEHETYEVEHFYAALLAKAREDREPMAVRSLTFALSADREHARLLAGALASLGERPAPGTLYVCPFCGKTVTSLDFRKCPNCFTPAGRFVPVT